MKLEFLTVAPHVNPLNITPILCSRACQSMNYRFSRIQFREYCFCKNSTVSSTKVVDQECERVESECSNNPGFYCGTDKYSFVYENSILNNNVNFSK